MKTFRCAAMRADADLKPIQGALKTFEKKSEVIVLDE
jgi:hypothetical protein